MFPRQPLVCYNWCPCSELKKMTERTGVRQMEGVLDKDQSLEDGRVEAEDGKLDLEDSSDDEEVKLLRHRRGADVLDLPGADICDVPEALDTQREEWLLTTEPLLGARPKWNRVGRPLVVPGQIGAEATGGIAGRNIEHRVATGLAEYARGGSGNATDECG